MKKLLNTLLICGMVVASTSCKKYLDVNTNPNSVVKATPDLILPQALAATAGLSMSFNNYGAWAVGMQANAGGYSGYGSVVTYNYSTSDNAGLWSSTFDNLNDYQYILNNTTSTGDLKYFNAVARTMKCFAYERLVDAYGDVPYSQALKGSDNVLPAYDKATDVYKALIADLNTAIASFKSAATGTTVKINSGSAGTIDITGMSGSTGLDMTKWTQFANTLKLRMLIRIQNVAALASTFTAEKAALENNFLTTDVTVNPGYVVNTGQQNPMWNAYAFSTTGAAIGTGLSQMPTTFAVAFYNGTKLVDDGRGKIVYKNYTANNQLGNQNNPPVSVNGSIWYSGTGSGTSATGLGILKGATMAQPIMLAAEGYFLQAEARLIGLLPGATVDAFNAGILASFTYLDKNVGGTVDASRNPATELTTYQANNTASYLVNPALWATPAGTDYNQSATERTREAIITQKWIALNFITADEAWNEYRRTGWPRTVPSGSAALNIASTQSLSTHADKLPTRILYPISEYNYNQANVPTGINQYTTLMFYAKQ